MEHNSEYTPRYCTGCGEIFDARVASCPECGARWPRTLPVNNVEIYVIMLTELANLKASNAIDDATYSHLRDIYETRLVAARRPRRATPAQPEPAPVRPEFAPPPVPAAAEQPAAVAATVTNVSNAEAFPVSERPEPAVAAATPEAGSGFEPPPRTPLPPSPPRDLAGAVREWTTARQADLVLYMGAFMLSVSALILVDYQGDGLSDLAKSAILGGYTALFLVLGIVLRRWDRVKEASPVFLGLGAILTPLNFLLLYTGVLRDGDTPQEWVWLIGSISTAALYYLLAARGYGRLYVIPAGVATLLAWGSLGATLNLPARWFGAWFMLAALGANASQRTGFLPRRYCEILAASMAIPALGYALLWAAFGDARSWQLALTTLLLAATIAHSAFPGRRVIPLSLLPPVAGLFAGALTAAVPLMDDSGRWLSLWLLVTAGGYVALVELRRELRNDWLAIAGTSGAIALLFAHREAAFSDLAPARLPVTYLVTLALVGWVAYRHRLPQAFIALPPLVAGTGASLWWFFGSFEGEWLGFVFVTAGVGYLILAWLRPAEALTLRACALATGANGLLIAATAAGIANTEPYQVPLTFALFSLAAIIDGTRFRASLIAAPAVIAYGGGALLWAAGVEPEWWAFPAAGLALGLAGSARVWRRDELLALAGWPYALGLALVPVGFVAQFADHEVHGAVAFAAAAITFLVASLNSDGAIVRLLRIQQANAGRWEQQMLARLGGWLLFVSLGYTNEALGLSLLEGAWTFAVVGIACWLVIPVGRRRLPFDAVLGPIGLTALAVATLAAIDEVEQASLMLALGAAAGVVAVGGSKPNLWRSVCAGLGLLALLFTLTPVANETPAWEIPLAVTILFAAALADAFFRRFELSWLTVPVLGSLAVASVIWWQEWPREHCAWAPLAFAIAIGLTGRWWQPRPLLEKAAWPYALLLSLAPVPFTEDYLAAPVAGAGAFALATAAWGIAAWRSNGRLLALFTPPEETSSTWERRLLTWGAMPFLFAALGFINASFELGIHDSAWLFAGVSTAGFLAVAIASRNHPELHWLAVPGAFAAFAIAVVASEDQFGQLAVVVAIATAGNLALVVGTRKPAYALTSTALAFAALGLAWAWRDWPLWSLALSYTGAAVALFVAFAPQRRKERTSASGQVAVVLSTVPMVVALVTGLAALSARAWSLPGDESIEQTAEWAVFAAIVAVTGVLVMAEGWWQRTRELVIAGSAILLFALELGIAAFEPSNSQAYTLPAAAYFLGLGLLLRSKTQVAGPHLLLNELWLVVGAALLVLPSAQQSLAGEAVYGLVLIGEGVVLLVGGLLISQRWLTVVGVLTLGASAVRFFTAGDGSRLPYWLTLGIVGLVLLGLGVLLLLERDWWTRTRHRLGRWWFADEPLAEHGQP